MQRLKDCRKERKLSQQQLAKAARITQPSLSDLETGETKVVAGDTLIRLARALKVRAEWLMTGEGERDIGGSDYRDDERALIQKYRRSSPIWRAALQNLAELQGEQQDWVMGSVLDRVFQAAAPDEKVEQHLPPIRGGLTLRSPQRGGNRKPNVK
jgi:transcriptional regulator with XRE-family HTH domain